MQLISWLAQKEHQHLCVLHRIGIGLHRRGSNTVLLMQILKPASTTADIAAFTLPADQYEANSALHTCRL